MSDVMGGGDVIVRGTGTGGNDEALGVAASSMARVLAREWYIGGSSTTSTP